MEGYWTLAGKNAATEEARDKMRYATQMFIYFQLFWDEIPKKEKNEYFGALSESEMMRILGID